MSKRKALSKRTRFEIFKRDGFRCIYCGATPMASPLHVDHVEPVSAGGSNDPSNLVTACESCNLGKSSVPLDRKALTANGASDAQIEQPEQLRGYLALQREVAAAKREAANFVMEHWSDCGLAENTDIDVRIPALLEQFTVGELLQAIDITARKNLDWWKPQVQYFHGILRKWRNEKEGR